MFEVNGAHVTMADLDGDGDEDIIATVYGNRGLFQPFDLGYLLFLRNDGEGNFETIILAEDLGVSHQRMGLFSRLTATEFSNMAFHVCPTG